MDFSIWQTIHDLNSDSIYRPAVGRICTIREPSPVIFRALHLIYNRDFDMDELFQHLISIDSKFSTTAHMYRAFSADPRQRRSYFFNFQYFTIVGKDIEPMPWQMSDTNHEHHPRISRCSSILALSLSGEHVQRLRGVSRRSKGQIGFLHDPWAPWQVLNIQCYPDYKHSMDTHDSTKHYVNGPEAFMHTLLAEYRDAHKRYQSLYTDISGLALPPADFIFNESVRDRLLFDDANWTYSRRYFWAYQTLGIIGDSIRSLIAAYQGTFADVVWERAAKDIFWPIMDEKASRNIYFSKRMNAIKRDFQKKLTGLEQTLTEQQVELGAVTIMQAHNMKLLALATILFLPLIFVACIFGITNMPSDKGFRNFTIVIIRVCLPFYLFVATLNTKSEWSKLFRKILGHGAKIIAPPEQRPVVAGHSGTAKIEMASSEKVPPTTIGTESSTAREMSQDSGENTFVDATEKLRGGAHKSDSKWWNSLPRKREMNQRSLV